jgi:hypothetical protein
VPVIKGKALKWPYYCMELKGFSLSWFSFCGVSAPHAKCFSGKPVFPFRISKTTGFFFFFFEISKKTGLEREEAFSDWAFDLSLLLEARDIDSELVNNDDR